MALAWFGPAFGPAIMHERLPCIGGSQQAAKMTKAQSVKTAPLHLEYG